MTRLTSIHLALHQWTLVGIFLLGVVMVGGRANPAHGQLRLCNKMEGTISIAVGFPVGGEWVSRGWYHAVPEECVTAQSSLRNRYYYFYYQRAPLSDDAVSGMAENGFTPDAHMCVADEAFSIVGTGNCVSRGYERRGFYKIDTKSYEEFTFEIVSAVQMREGVADLQVGVRSSLLDSDTKVLVLRNYQPHYVTFNLRCYKRTGHSKTLLTNVPSWGRAEVGFVQGWPGNFVSGERCEALDRAGDVVWTYAIP